MHFRKRRALAASVMMAVPSLAGFAKADSRTWVLAAATPGLFNTAANWSGNAVPTSSDVALFDTGAIVQWDNTTGNTSTAGLSLSSGSVQFSSAGAPFTYTVGTASLSAATLSLNHENLTVNGALDLEANAGLIISTSSTFTGSGTIPGWVSLAGGSFNVSDNTTLSGKLSYSSGILNIASGKTFDVAGGSASFSGQYLLNDGATLAVTNGGTISSSSAIDVGYENTGTLLVDGLGSNISDGSLALWAFAGGQSTVTFSNNAVGTYSGGLQIGTGISTGVATVNIASNAQISTSTLIVGSGFKTLSMVNVNGGTLSASATTTFGNGAIVTLDAGGLNLLGPVTEITPGATFSYVGGQLSMTSGETLSVGGEISLTSGANKRIRVGSLSMSGTGQIDLSDNRMIIDYSGSTPISTIRTYLISGRNGGSWNGVGLASRAAGLVAANGSDIHKTGLGYGESSTLFGPSGGSFAGETVDGTAVLVRYTLLGDNNLDGQVNSMDFDMLASHYGQTGVGWTDGDYNYDGTVNALDFNELATNYGLNISISAEQLPGSLVPEPTVAIIVVMTSGWFYRRCGRCPT